MKLMDVFTEEEDKRVQELKVEILQVQNAGERESILREAEWIFKAAEQRYYALVRKKAI